MRKLKIPILKALILLLHKNIEVGVNFIFLWSWTDEVEGIWQVIYKIELKLIK
jgi:hypothetical protein